MNLSLFDLNLNQKWKETLRRFPIVMIMAFITTILLIWFIAESENTRLIRLIMTGFIGFLSSLVVTQYNNHHNLSQKTKIIWWSSALIMMIAYYAFIPKDIEVYSSCFWVLTVGIFIVLHLLSGLVPFIDNADNKAFTAYNTILFVSWWQTTFLCLILYGVMCLCLIALDNLFGVSIPNNIYTYLFVLIGGIFHTSYFLSEIPEDTKTFIKPKYSILKILLWYVMVPSLYIFGSILLAFIIKTLFTDKVQINESIGLILSYSFLTMIVWLLLYFYDESVEPAWVSWFRKNYYMISLPIWTGLFFYIYKSIKADGITYGSYFWAACAMYLLIVSTFYIAYKVKADKRAWPALLVFMVLGLTLPGPLSFCKVPIRNQQERTVSMLKEKGYIKNNAFVSKNKPVWNDSLGKWNRVINNLDQKNGLDFLNVYNKNKVIAKDTIRVNDLMTYMGAYDPSFMVSSYKSIGLPHKAFSIEGWKQVLPLRKSEVDEEDYVYITHKAELRLFIKGKNIGTYDLSAWVKSDSIDSNKYPQKIVNINDKTLGIIFTSLNCQINSIDEVSNLDVQGMVLMK